MGESYKLKLEVTELHAGAIRDGLEKVIGHKGDTTLPNSRITKEDFGVYEKCRVVLYIHSITNNQGEVFVEGDSQEAVKSVVAKLKDTYQKNRQGITHTNVEYCP